MENKFFYPVLGALCFCAIISSGNKVEKIYDFVGIQQHGLKWHNYYRQVFELPKIQLHDGLTNLAQNHAEFLSTAKNLTLANKGFKENLWVYQGPFFSPEKDLEHAVKTWYTGSMKPGGQIGYSIDYFILRSPTVKYVGFGVAKNPTDHFTAVVAMYL